MKDNPRIHKSPHHFYFDFSGAPQTTDEIIERINNNMISLMTFLRVLNGN